MIVPTSPAFFFEALPVGAPAYQWLNHLQCVNIGAADLERFEVFL